MRAYNKRVAARIFYQRTMARLSQRALEARIGSGASFLTIYETCKRMPQLGTLLAIANGIGCDVRDLIPSSLSDKDDPVPPSRLVHGCKLRWMPKPVEPKAGTVLPDVAGIEGINVPDMPDPANLAATNGEAQQPFPDEQMPWDDAFDPKVEKEKAAADEEDWDDE